MCLKLDDFLAVLMVTELSTFTDVTLNVGAVASGTVNVKDTVFDPTFVEPLYVSQVITHVPLNALLKFAARSGIVHAYEVPTPVAMVTFVFPVV